MTQPIWMDLGLRDYECIQGDLLQNNLTECISSLQVLQNRVDSCGHSDSSFAISLSSDRKDSLKHLCKILVIDGQAFTKLCNTNSPVLKILT